ncbi:ABC transporter permease [Haploplasma axanthum]|uniref:Transport permease protein n=1 Tax=Haploplasma axanthum TaxID=29552 RepID=A0A449BDS5_HAPAX|nr:ABC transporter permease [Haploplasma axanthum]VEU80596.1 ABC-type transport system involved in multi-copper enzyme maturation, permease component [Haploplasma axanthum]
MKTLIYSKRNLKELLNDPISLIFIIGLPVFLLIFMVSLNKSLSFNESFEVENFVPSTIIFSYTFLTMFSGMLIAKDRTSSFLSRMFVSPLKAYNYILGYMFPILIIALIQTVILYIVGFILGLAVTINILYSIIFLLIISILFISLGLLFGSVLKDQQVGPITSILIQVVAFLSGMWFSLDLIGGAFKKVGYLLPFAHSVDLIRDIIKTNSINTKSLIVVLIYIIGITVLAILVFKKNMKK